MLGVQVYVLCREQEVSIVVLVLLDDQPPAFGPDSASASPSAQIVQSETMPEVDGNWAAVVLLMLQISHEHVRALYFPWQQSFDATPALAGGPSQG